MLGVLKALVVCIPGCSVNDVRWGYNMDIQLGAAWLVIGIFGP